MIPWTKTEQGRKYAEWARARKARRMKCSGAGDEAQRQEHGWWCPYCDEVFRDRAQAERAQHLDEDEIEIEPLEE